MSVDKRPKPLETFSHDDCHENIIIKGENAGFFIAELVCLFGL